jgi:2-polyprenyl-6-hydroxyphenyl methylase/3-demethylubiquinone-9 3-methyltransferase
MPMPQKINNEFYDDLNERWLSASDHPIALLRAENMLRNPWIISHIQTGAAILDIGCGAGLFTNEVAKKKPCKIFGVDQSIGALEIAKAFDETKSVVYQQANAEKLPFDDASFDIICAMDLLEHVENPKMVIAEASRVLKPGGKFFFHTFNRNFLSYLIIVKAVEKFIANTPKNLHLHSMFIKPKELNQMLCSYALVAKEWKGIRPVIFQKAWRKVLSGGIVPADFRFCFISSLSTGYCGFAEKISSDNS